MSCWCPVNDNLQLQITSPSPLHLPAVPARKLHANMSDTFKRSKHVRSHMCRATPRMRNLARNLMVYETPGNDSNGSTAQDAFNFNERLRPQLATLYGIAGYKSLLSRAL